MQLIIALDCGMEPEQKINQGESSQNANLRHRKSVSSSSPRRQSMEPTKMKRFVERVSC